jgi:hypothetical protein
LIAKPLVSANLKKTQKKRSQKEHDRFSIPEKTPNEHFTDPPG